MTTRMTETQLEQYYDTQDEEQVRDESGLTRIKQLERLCQQLSAQVDRMQPVVTAVRVLVETGKQLDLHLAYEKYKKRMVELTGEGADTL